MLETQPEKPVAAPLSPGIVLFVRHALTVGWIGPGIEPLQV